MGILTWRDVAAPNFDGVQDGFRNFGQLVSKALDSASSGIKAFDQDKTDRVNNAVLAQVAGAQDENAAQQILSSLASNPNADRISTETMKTAMSRPGDLIRLAGDKGDLAWKEAGRARTKEEQDLLDAAGPDANKYLTAMFSGDTKTAQGLASQNPALAALHPNQLIDLLTKGQDLTKSNLSITDDQTRQANTATDRDEARKAEELKYAITGNGIDLADFPAYVANHKEELHKQGYSDLVIGRALHSVVTDPTSVGSFYNQGGSSAGGGVGGSGPVDLGAAQTTVANEFKSAGLSDAVTAGFLGNFHVEGGYTGKQGDNGTAAGIAQLRGSRRDAFIQMFGKDPSQADPAEQVKYTVWELTTPQGRKVAGISDEQANAILNAKDAGTAANLIDQFYERSDGKARSDRISAANQFQSLLVRGVQDRTGVVAPQITRASDDASVFAEAAVPLLNDRANIRQVAARLTADGGELKGQNMDYVASKLDEIQQKYKGVSPALAGLILTSSAGGVQGVGGKVADFFHVGDGLSVDINADKVAQFAKLAQNPKALMQHYNAAQTQNDISQLTASASQAATAATAAATDKARRAAALGRKVDVGPIINQAVTAEGKRQQALVTSSEVAAAGSNQPGPPPPKLNQRNVPKHTTPTAAPAPAVRAQSYLLREFQNMVPNSAGPVQMKGVEQAFQQKYGVTIQQVRNNPTLAWEAAKKADNRATSILAAEAARRAALFAR